LRRYYRSQYEARAGGAQRPLNDASFIRLLNAVNYLDDDDETHQKYFGDATGGWHLESHPPLFGPKNKRGEPTTLKRKTILASNEYSDDLKEALRDKAFNKDAGGFVSCVINPECEKWDAARHISGLKRNCITVPQDWKALEAWVMQADKQYQKVLQLKGTSANYDDDWYEWKSRVRKAKQKRGSSDRQNGPTLAAFFRSR
jgi:hypothetical protein